MLATVTLNLAPGGPARSQRRIQHEERPVVCERRGGGKYENWKRVNAGNMNKLGCVSMTCSGQNATPSRRHHRDLCRINRFRSRPGEHQAEPPCYPAFLHVALPPHCVRGVQFLFEEIGAKSLRFNRRCFGNLMSAAPSVCSLCRHCLCRCWKSVRTAPVSVLPLDD